MSLCDNSFSTKKRTGSFEKSISRLEEIRPCKINEVDEIEWQEGTERMYEIVSQIPRYKKVQTTACILPLAHFLIKYNPFFKNLSVVLVSSFLRACKIKVI